MDKKQEEKLMANSWKRHSSRIDDDESEGYLSPGYPTSDDIPDECVIVPAEQTDAPNYPDHPDDETLEDTTVKAWELIQNLVSLYLTSRTKVEDALVWYEQEHLAELNQHLSDLIEIICRP